MFRVFEATTANDVWLQIAESFRQEDGREQQSRVGDTREILRAAITVTDPRQRWVTARRPSINPAFAIAEVIWIMTGRNDAEFLNFFNRQLPKFAGDDAAYHGAYGSRLRNHFGLDQLDRAFNALKHKDHSRQVVLQVWDSTVDLPDHDGSEASLDVPCNVLSMLKVRDGKLEWTQIVRSNDLFRGVPYNFVQFSSLHEIIAGWLDVELGTYNQLSDSLHVYEPCLKHIEESDRVPSADNEDCLAFPKAESDTAFAELAQQVDALRVSSSDARELLSRVRDSMLPSPYKNMFCVLAAEAARRNKDVEGASEIMELCTNSVFRQLFDQWITRLQEAEKELAV